MKFFKGAARHARVVWEVVRPILIEFVIGVVWALLAARLYRPRPAPGVAA